MSLVTEQHSMRNPRAVLNTLAEGRSDRADAMYDELIELIYKHSR